MQGAAKLKGWMQVVATVALVTLLAACGGGGRQFQFVEHGYRAALPPSPGAQPVCGEARQYRADHGGQRSRERHQYSDG